MADFLYELCGPKRKRSFDKPVSRRSREQINFLREKLKSSEFGWKIFYKPAALETGYYQFLFHFLNDTEVETASDFIWTDLTFQKSEYSILLGSTTKLSFAVWGPIHKLSDSGFSPIPNNTGAGLKGDFEFLYYGENDKGLIFRANRTQETLLFTKATATSLSDLKSSYSNSSKLKFVYRSMSESGAGNEIKSAFEFPYDARVIKFKSVLNEVKEGETVSLNVEYITGYGLVPEGIFLDSVMRGNGAVVKNLIFKHSGRTFSTTLEDGTQITIGK